MDSVAIYIRAGAAVAPAFCLPGRTPAFVPRDGEVTVYGARPDASGVLQTRAVKLRDALPRRTLANLYSERPAELDNAHRDLDEAVFAAYGWNESDLNDEEILTRLLQLNQSSA